MIKKLVFCFIAVSVCILTGCYPGNDAIIEPSYDISGHVFGLKGELGLTLNNEDTLLVSDPSVNEFKFNRKLITNLKYSVKITKQPETQRCYLDSGEGLISSENIDDLIIHCRTFYRGFQGVSEISAGQWHSCAIVTGQVRCWGGNYNGQLSVPNNLINPRKISAGFFSCVLDDSGVVCWGYENFSGVSVPAPPQNLVNVHELQVGNFSACAIDDHGLHCWGYENSVVVIDTPLDLIDPHDLVVKDGNACVIDGGRPVCWGNSEEISKLPDFLFSVDKIDVGKTHACAVSLDIVTCWGSMLGEGVGDVPVDLELVTDIELSAIASCAVTSTGVKCWGNSSFGVSDISDIVEHPSSLSFEAFHGCAIEVGELICVGSNEFGESEIPRY